MLFISPVTGSNVEALGLYTCSLLFTDTLKTSTKNTQDFHKNFHKYTQNLPQKRLKIFIMTHKISMHAHKITINTHKNTTKLHKFTKNFHKYTVKLPQNFTNSLKTSTNTQ